MSVSAQQYCLRWNNHRSNLLTVFDELLQNEAFTDVTLACDGGAPIKCHRMVLAACSPYFQNLFIDLPCKHPVVVLKDVKHSEIKAILEYMYRGEVNVAQDQLAALLKVAETLKVKGLVEENRSRPGSAKHEEHLHQLQESPPLITTTAGAVHSSSNPSPPSASYKNHYYAKSPTALERSPRMNLPMWAVPGLPLPHHTSPVPTQNHPHPAATAAAAMLSCYEASGSDMSPLKRKKLSSLLMNRDTPILRTVLGQGQADSSQPVSLVCHPDSHESLHSNGSDDRMEKHMKNEPSEDAQSPYTDFSSVIDDEEKPKMAVPSSSPQSYANDMRSSGIATYVPTQKPEWKRYKQYSRQEIMAAIEAVRNGMSALQAARKYGVPSRTLYDKVKKLGITTSRPFKRGSNGSTTYGSGSPFGSHLFESDEASMNNNSALMEASTFLQHAMDRSGDERDSLAAMVAAATLHQARNNASPPGHARSPSPNSSLMSSGERDDDEVEDLSMGRKPQQRDQQPVESGHTVIMGPTTQLIKKEEVMN